jgi:DNA polymerase-3 subunit gamma/tau
MSHYIPLATKYRPQKFSQVVGQDITVRIITRGMQKNRLGSALLFAGTRGVGKTTIARILAKALRCTHSDPEPCGKCESCLGFLRDNQIDVIEIDAASNTGVEDVREIIESCRYRPTTGQYKIFIIDEVHMLSKSAFNALLKTLEEPPEHVKFLMATTETHKIPETILSRVLRFDLKRVDQDLIAQYLSTICNQEDISANADALSLIARAADGSIRDSLSILDQAINLAEGNRIDLQDVKDLLNFAEDADLIE